MTLPVLACLIGLMLLRFTLAADQNDGSLRQRGKARGSARQKKPAAWDPLGEDHCFPMNKGIILIIYCWLLASPVAAEAAEPGLAQTYEVHAIGWVRKTEGLTVIEVDEQYLPAMLGVDRLDAIWVLYWFDRNDTPQQRAILQVHPRRDTGNPLRGVFATRAPVRPNLIALSRCRVLSVKGNLIEIDGIDAFPDTPVLDIKP